MRKEGHEEQARATFCLLCILQSRFVQREESVARKAREASSAGGEGGERRGNEADGPLRPRRTGRRESVASSLLWA